MEKIGVVGCGPMGSGIAEAVRDAKPGPVRWKVVIAAESPWAGVVYETRAGQRRESFEGQEEFVRAIMRLTGWQPPDPMP